MIVAYWMGIIFLGITGILVLSECIQDVWNSDKRKGPY